MLACIIPLQYWLGRKVQVECRVATSKEVGQARYNEEETEREKERHHPRHPGRKVHQDDGRYPQTCCEPWWRSPEDTDLKASHLGRMRQLLLSGYMK